LGYADIFGKDLVSRGGGRELVGIILGFRANLVCPPRDKEE
jgi:hypothetical protein